MASERKSPGRLGFVQYSDSDWDRTSFVVRLQGRPFEDRFGKVTASARQQRRQLAADGWAPPLEALAAPRKPGTAIQHISVRTVRRLRFGDPDWVTAPPNLPAWTVPTARVGNIDRHYMNMITEMHLTMYERCVTGGAGFRSVEDPALERNNLEWTPAEDQTLVVAVCLGHNPAAAAANLRRSKETVLRRAEKMLPTEVSSSRSETFESLRIILDSEPGYDWAAAVSTSGT